jgi:hypothetical protein
MNLDLPKALTDALPDSVRPYALFIVLGIVGIAALFGLIILFFIARLIFGRGKGKADKESKLAERLTEYPDLKPSTGDRQLRIEGVPVRMRLVVVAPAGTASEVDMDDIPDMLERIVPGLGEIYKYDKPRVKVWPTQVSYQGFATFFHRNTLTGAKDGEQTRWAMAAGRVKLCKQQVMLGLALQSVKPNTVGRRTVDSHEWASMLRVRVKGGD